jgi:glutamate/tyrosine decarboxylase-like PLP-dependent enzyme
MESEEGRGLCLREGDRVNFARRPELDAGGTVTVRGTVGASFGGGSGANMMALVMASNALVGKD